MAKGSGVAGLPGKGTTWTYLGGSGLAKVVVVYDPARKARDRTPHREEICMERRISILMVPQAGGQHLLNGRKEDQSVSTNLERWSYSDENESRDRVI